MPETAVERRGSIRRNVRPGGRRATDRRAARATTPECPNCRRAGAAVLAGEAEGGWWFVCEICDHLWDQRTTVGAGEYMHA
jgi:hypothetical protein